MARAGPPRRPDWLWPRCSRPPGNEWMGGLSARPSAGRTGPAGTCWGQDPGSKMATVIPGPLRCCGPAGGGGGSAGGSRGRMCVAAGGGADGVSGGLSPWAGLRGVASVCDCGSLARTVSDALLLEERRVCGTPSPLREGGSCPALRPPGLGRR